MVLAYAIAWLVLAAAAEGGLFFMPAFKKSWLDPSTFSGLFMASLAGFVAATAAFGIYLSTSPNWRSQGGFATVQSVFKPLLILHGGIALGVFSKNLVVGVLGIAGLGVMVHLAAEQLRSRSGVAPPSSLLRREGQAVANWAPAAREGGGGERIDIYCAHPRLGNIPPPLDTRRRLWDVYRDAEALVLGLGAREILGLSPDGRWLVTSGAGKVFLQNMITNARLVMTGTSKAAAVGAGFYVNRDAGGTGSSAVLLVRGDGATEEWQVSTGSGARRNPLIQGGSLTRAYPSPDGTWVGAIDGAGNFIVFFRTGQHARPFPRASGEARITSVAVSPNADLIALATARKKDEESDEEKGGILELAAPDGREAPRQAEGRFGLILSVAFSPSGSAVAFSTWKGVVFAWVLAEPVPRRLADGLDADRGITFLDDSTVAAFKGGKPIAVPLERRSEPRGTGPGAASPTPAAPVGDEDDEEDVGPIVVAEAFRWKGAEAAKRRPTRAMSVYAGGGKLVVAEQDGSCSVWDAREAKLVELREGHRGPIGYLRWDISDKMLYSMSLLSAQRLAFVDAWEVRSSSSGALASTAVLHPDARIVPGADWYQSVQVCATGVACAWHSGASVHIVDLTEPSLRSLENEHRGPITSIALSPDGQEIAIGHDDGLLRVWSTGEMEILRTWKAHSGSIDDVKFSANGKFIATMSANDGAAVWESHTARRVWAAGGGKGARETLTTLAIAPEGDRIAVAARDGQVDLWTLKDGSVKHLSELKVAPWALVFSARGDMLAGGDQSGVIGMWDVRSTTWLGQVPFAVQGAAALAVRSEPRLLAVGDITGSVRVWAPK